MTNMGKLEEYLKNLQETGVMAEQLTILSSIQAEIEVIIDQISQSQDWSNSFAPIAAHPYHHKHLASTITQEALGSS